MHSSDLWMVNYIDDVICENVPDGRRTSVTLAELFYTFVVVFTR